MSTGMTAQRPLDTGRELSTSQGVLNPLLGFIFVQRVKRHANAATYRGEIDQCFFLETARGDQQDTSVDS